MLTTTTPLMKPTIVLLEESEVRQQVKILVGGAPVTDEHAASIGAEAATAVERATMVERAKEPIGVASAAD